MRWAPGLGVIRRVAATLGVIRREGEQVERTHLEVS